MVWHSLHFLYALQGSLLGKKSARATSYSVLGHRCADFPSALKLLKLKLKRDCLIKWYVSGRRRKALKAFLLFVGQSTGMQNVAIQGWGTLGPCVGRQPHAPRHAVIQPADY